MHQGLRCCSTNSGGWAPELVQRPSRAGAEGIPVGRLCPVLPAARAHLGHLSGSTARAGRREHRRDFGGEDNASHSSLPSRLCNAGVSLDQYF